MTITGPAPGQLAVVGNTMGSPSPIFGVNVAVGQTARIEKLKIADARAFSFFGGGISKGGGGALELDNVWLFDNSAAAGGAVGYSQGTTTITNSLLSNNRAEPTGGDGFGGAISGQTSGSGHANVINSTLTNNSATQYGGAISVSNNATLTINSSTIAGNTANSDNSTNGDGGGIFRNNSAGSVMIANTVLAGNTVGPPGAGTNFQCLGAFTSQGFNLRSTADTGCMGFTGTGDVASVDPLLGTLGSNGGPLQTIPLLTGSPAINAGNPVTVGGAFPACPATDQRGLPRGGGAGVCDIGAFEVQPPPPEPPTPPTPPAGGATVTPFNLKAAIKKCKKQFRKGTKAKKKRKKCIKRAKKRARALA